MAWLTGWTYRQSITVDSNGVGLSGNLTDKTICVHVPSSNTNFWTNVKADGTDVRFTSSDETTTLKFEIESFDNTGDDAWYHIKIPSLTSATDTVIYLYYGNSGASSGEDINNTWDSSYKGVWHLNQDKAAGAFADSTSNANNGTNNSTTDATGQIDRGRDVNMVTPTRISIADSDTLTFNSGGVDTAMTLTAWVKMTDATRFRIFSKGDSAANDGEYFFGLTGADTLQFAIYPNVLSASRSRLSSGTFTADEGAWIQLAVTYDGSESGDGMILYRNGAVSSSSAGSTGGYSGMTNTTRAAYIASYHAQTDTTGSGIIDEVTIAAANRSADWIIADYQSGLGTWLTFGSEELNVISPSSLSATFTLLSPTFPTIVGPSPLTATFTVPDPTFSVPALVLPDPLVGNFTLNAPDVQKILILADPLIGTLAINSPTISLPSIITVSPLTGVFAIFDPDVIDKTILIGVVNFPNAQTVEYKIIDDSQTVLQDWSSIGVFELATTATKSTYCVKTNKINQNFQGALMWRIPSTTYQAVEILNIYQSYVDILHNRLNNQRALNLDNLDAAMTTRLSSVSYTAPDNAGIAAIKAKTDNLPQGVQKNTVLNNFTFGMMSSNDGKTSATGLTITARRSIDGGAFAVCTNSASELGNGTYKINLSATDLNGDVITLLFTGSGAIDRVITILTNP